MNEQDERDTEDGNATWHALLDVVTTGGLAGQHAAHVVDRIMTSDVWRNRQPQPTEGEPSEALIVDMLTAYYGEERDGWSMRKVDRLLQRAALRAAGLVADQEGENRGQDG